MTESIVTGQPITGALPIAVPTTTVGRLVFAGDCRVVGWSFKETTGAAAAEVQLFDGYDATGTPVAFITLTAGQSTRDLTSPDGILFQQGVFAAVASGSVAGSVWVIDQ